MKALLAMALTGALTAGPVFADCHSLLPQDSPKIPDGATATLEQMVAGQKEVAAYQKAINDYTACIDKELDDNIAKEGDKLKPKDKEQMQRMTDSPNHCVQFGSRAAQRRSPLTLRAAGSVHGASCSRQIRS